MIDLQLSVVKDRNYGIVVEYLVANFFNKFCVAWVVEN